MKFRTMIGLVCALFLCLTNFILGLLMKKRTLTFMLLQNFLDSPHARSLRGLVLCVVVVAVSALIIFWLRETRTGHVWNIPVAISLTVTICIWIYIISLSGTLHGTGKDQQSVLHFTGYSSNTSKYSTIENVSFQTFKHNMHKSSQNQGVISDLENRVRTYSTKSDALAVKENKKTLKTTFKDSVKEICWCPQRPQTHRSEDLKYTRSYMQSSIDINIGPLMKHVVCAVPFTDCSEQIYSQSDGDDDDQIVSLRPERTGENMHPSTISSTPTLLTQESENNMSHVLQNELSYIQNYLRRPHSVRPVVNITDITDRQVNDTRASINGESVCEIENTCFMPYSDNNPHSSENRRAPSQESGEERATCSSTQRSDTNMHIDITEFRTLEQVMHRENTDCNAEEIDEHITFSCTERMCDMNDTTTPSTNETYVKLRSELSISGEHRRHNASSYKRHSRCEADDLQSNDRAPTNNISDNSTGCHSGSSDKQKDTCHKFRSENDGIKSKLRTDQNKYIDKCVPRRYRSPPFSYPSRDVYKDHDWNSDHRESFSSCRYSNKHHNKRVAGLTNKGLRRVEIRWQPLLQTNQNILQNIPVQESNIYSVGNRNNDNSQNGDFISLREARRVNIQMFIISQIVLIIRIMRQTYLIDTMLLLIVNYFAFTRTHGRHTYGSGRSVRRTELPSQNKNENGIAPLPVSLRTRMCRLCQAFPVVRFVPCNHSVCCGECAMKVSACPQCRRSIVDTTPEYST